MGSRIFDERTPGFVRFSADSMHLVVRTSDGLISQLAVQPAEWVAAACEAASRELTPEESAVVRPGAKLRATCDRAATGG